MRFSNKHEWVNKEGYVGISDFAQKSLGDIVFVELPAVGDKITTGKVFGTVESVKAVSELYAPVSGRVIEINEALENSPELLNEDAYKNWIVKIEFENPDEKNALMNKEEYEEFCKNG